MNGIKENKISELEGKIEINQDTEGKQKTIGQETIAHMRLLRKILKIWNQER